MQIDALKFVMLASRDVKQSVGFYRDRLGLPLTSQFEDFAFFDCGSLTLVLSGDLGRGTPQSGTAVEIVFSVPSVRAAYDELRVAGLEFVNAPRPVTDGGWAATFNDPDGHLLSFYGDE